MELVESQGSNNGWVEVTSCRWLHEARLLVSVLAAADIEAMIPGEHALDVQPAFAIPTGGVRVVVKAGDRLRALEMLAATTSVSGADDGSDVA